MTKFIKLVLLVFLLIILPQLSSCSSYINPQLLNKFHSNNEPTKPVTLNGDIKIQYLGVSGYLITYDGHKLLLGPSFTNPGYGTLASSLLSGELKANHKLIEKLYPDTGKNSADANQKGIEAILVGHSHYDHLLDVPYIMKNFIPSAKAYGSNTMKSLLLSKDIDEDNIVALNDYVSDNKHHEDNNWQSVNSGRIRFVAIKADHAPIVFNHVFANGRYKGDRLHKKLDFLDWKLGETYAYLIDFMDKDGNIDFRIHYVDTSSPPPNGFLPDELLNEKRVDLAILCVAGFNKSALYPKEIITHLNPKTIIAGHWEHFFGNHWVDNPSFESRSKTLRVVAGSDHQKFIKRLKAVLPADATWILPRPFTTIGLPTQ
ncbi:MAG: hypothetical protein MJK04_25960 [Psychrosphaera sp.]|nr:hypothetical protein [Psychrosphaera sp.]